MEEKQSHSLKKIESYLADYAVIFKSLFLVAGMFTLYFAGNLFLPIVLSFVLYFLLFPVVDIMLKLKIPKFLGSAIVIIILLGVVGYAFYFLSQQANSWLEKGPYLIDEVNLKIETLTSFLKKPIQILSAITADIEGILNLSGGKVQTSWYSIIFSNTWTFLIEFFMTLIILYFLLASKNFFLIKLVKLLPHLKQEKDAVKVVKQIETQVWKYLFARTLINIGVAIVVSFFLWLFQLPNPILWGSMAGILEFIPFIGAMISLTVIFFVSLVSFETVWQILLPPLTFFVFISLEGNVFTPYVLGRSMVLNKVAVVLAIFLFSWVWGVMGSFLAVPIVMTTKIILDNINKDNLMKELLEE